MTKRMKRTRCRWCKCGDEKHDVFVSDDMLIVRCQKPHRARSGKEYLGTAYFPLPSPQDEDDSPPP